MSGDDHRLDEAKAMPILDVAERLGIDGLRQMSGEMVGPCPVCGGNDRFGINPKKGIFGCRKECGPFCKGDQVALVQHVRGCDFRAALDWLCGPAQEIPAEELELRRKKAAERKRRQEETARRERNRAILAARDIWAGTVAADGGPVLDYLALRGIDPARIGKMPETIRFHPDMAYTIPVAGKRGEWRVLFRGPCMVASITDAGFRTTAVHRTWIDLSQPSGKAAIHDPNKAGDFLPAKKVLGSKKGGAIRLRTPKCGGLDTMIMGEGVETTLSAMVAAADDAPPAAYWAGVDLGNMSGQQERVPGTRWSGRPDMTDADAFLPPPWVKRLIFIQDGDSDPKATTAKLQAGLRRAMTARPGLQGFIAHAGDGLDMNDLLRTK